MYIKLSPRDLNLDFCPPHPTSIYTCGVTTALRMPRMRGGGAVFKGANSEYLTTYYLRIYYKGGIYNVYLRTIWSI